MRTYLAALFLGLGLLYPGALRGTVVYTFSGDFSGLALNPPGSTLNFQFSVPSILTSATMITTFQSSSVGPGLSGCVLEDTVLPISPFPGFAASEFVDFAGPCGAGQNITGELWNYLQLPTSLGVYNAYYSAGVQVGTLTIFNAPEPAAVFLLGGALVALAGWKVRRERVRSRTN